MSAVRAYPLGDGLVVDRGEAAGLVLLDARGRGIWQALADGTSPEVVAARLGDADAALRVAEIAAAREPAAAVAPAAIAPPARRRSWWPGRSRTYAPCGTPVAIDVADDEIAAFVHPRFAWAEVARARPVATLSLARAGDGFELAEAGRPPSWHRRGEALAGAVVRRVIELSHGTTAWSAVLHAGAVADGAGGAIVLAGSCGRGKSTLTAALTSCGHAYLSDDCVPLDAAAHALPVPFGLCLKESGWAVAERWLPESAGAPEFLDEERGRCRYVPPRRVARGRLPVTALVFPAYAPDAGLELLPLAPAEALAALVAGGAWLSRAPAHLAAVIALVERAPAWRLGYSDLAAACASIADLAAHCPRATG